MNTHSQTMKQKKIQTKARSKRLVDKQHLLNVSSLPCMVSRSGFFSCSGPIQVHHLLKPSDGKRGWGLKAGDDQVIPLCMFHHQQLHTKFGNEYKFFKHYGFKEDAGQKYATELYERTLNPIDDDLPF